VVNSGREDFRYFGFLEEKELIVTLTECHYGLIIYSSHLSNYFSTVMAGKLSTYLACGLPVVCPVSYFSMHQFVVKKDIGVGIGSLSELDSLPLVGTEAYQKKAKNAYLEGRKIIKGLHYWDAFKELFF
jgi:hypothetical protein